MTAQDRRAGSANPWIVLVLVCLAQFMVIVDATIVNVALPSIQTDLKLSEGNLQWVVNACALLFGGFLLLGGRAGDLIGRKRVFLAGLILFTLASLVCGLAQSETWLIISRGVQGFGAALVSPAVGLAVLSTIATTRTSNTLASLGHRPSAADEAGALVDGFHVAWLASALLLASGALLLLALLRRRDVVAASRGEPATVAA